MNKYHNKKWLEKMYIKKNLSQKKIAEFCNVNQSTIHYYLIRFNIPTRKFCGRPGIYSPRWKGGRYKSTQGYIFILNPDNPRAYTYKKYVPEQILVVEKYIKRYLTKEEAIHHINEIKDDNRLKNLYLFQNEAEHQRYHRNFRFGNVKRITKSNLFLKNE